MKIFWARFIYTKYFTLPQPNSSCRLIITRRNASTPSNLNFLFSTLRRTKRTPSIQRRPRDSSYAFISFCKSSSSLSVWTFPFLFLLLFYNLKSIPKSPKASGQPSNLRKKQSTSFCLPIPIQEAGGGPEGGAISSQPQAGIWQPIADRWTLSAWRLISLSPFRHFERNREISHAQFHHRK